MNKKMMLLAISVVSAALFAMPAVASANLPAHINATTAFTVAPNGPTSLETHTGETVTCHGGVAGNGTFTTTTTGTLNLTFSNCTVFGFVSCTSHVAEGGTGTSGVISTTPLEFHLISKLEPSHAGVLVTPNAATKVFAHFTCAGSAKTVTGAGVIGKITSPTCGGTSNKAGLTFAQGATGIQSPNNLTGVPYQLQSNGTNAAQIGSGTITFTGGNRTLTCT